MKRFFCFCLTFVFFQNFSFSSVSLCSNPIFQFLDDLENLTTEKLQERCRKLDYVERNDFVDKFILCTVIRGRIDFLNFVEQNYEQLELKDISHFSEIVSGDNRNILHLAAESGNFEFFKYIFEVYGKNIDILNCCDLGNTVFYYAIKSGNLDIIKFLLEKGEKYKNALFKGDRFSRSLLHNAVILHKKEIVSFLIEQGLDVNSVDSSGKKPLNYAMFSSFRPIAIIISENGGKL